MMKTYDSYIESGINWLGEVPSHWEIKRGKYVTKLLPGFAFNSDLFSSDDSDMPLIRIRDIMNTSTESFYSGPYSNAYIIRKGDVLVGMDGDFNVATWNGPDGLLNQRVCKVVDVPGFSARYAFYVLPRPLKCINDVTYSTTVKHLSTFDIYREYLPVPPIDEQKAIADYLDVECGKIDDLIAKEEKRVSLLQEVRLSILTKAVLHGLNEGVETAPSKHSWLGNIPKHWKIMPLRYTANAKGCCFIDGDWIESKDIDYDGSIKYLTTGNVGPGFYKEQGLGYISEEKFKELDCTDVLPGDLLISRLNEPIARTCIVPDLGSRIVTAVDNVIFRPNPNVLDRKFACYYMNNGRLTEHANIIARGATMHRISRTMLGHLPIVLPPLDEQREIVAFLDKECGQYDNRIVKANHQIDLLKEYKQSLITEVVTGKRKVC